jgi:hypothetical protein
MRAWHKLSLSLAVVVATAACDDDRRSIWGESCAYSGHCEPMHACYAERCAPLNGRRTVTNTDGDLHEGVFKDGYLVSGHITHAAGGHSEGKFEKGMLVDGEYRDAEGQREKGTFRDGRLVKGSRHAPDGSHASGEFGAYGLLNGIRLLADRTIESGSFAYGRLSKGRRRFPDGRSFEGPFDDEERLSCHRCEMRTATGDRIEGKFSKGLPDGEMSMKRANGAHYHGRIEDGRLSGNVRANLPDGSVLRGHMGADDILNGVKTLPGGGYEEGLFKFETLIVGWRVDAQGNVTIVE